MAASSALSAAHRESLLKNRRRRYDWRPRRAWWEPDPRESRVDFIKAARRKMREYLERPSLLLPTLAWVPIQGKPRAKIQYYSRREACITVMEILLHHMDYVTLRVGVDSRDRTKVLGVALVTIMKQSALSARRLDRAIRDLRDAGILTSHTRAARESWGYEGKISVRVISAAFFVKLGLGKKLRKLRAWAHHRRQSDPLPPEQFADKVMRLQGAHAAAGGSPGEPGDGRISAYLGTRRKPPGCT